VNVLNGTYDAYVKPSTSSAWSTVGAGLVFHLEQTKLPPRIHGSDPL